MNTCCCDACTFPLAYIHCAQDAILLGVNYGALGPAAAAHADLTTIYAELSSRSATPIISGLDATTVYPGVWSCTLYFTLGSGASVTFDTRNNPDAVFIMINSGYLHVSQGGIMHLVNGAQVQKAVPCHMIPF